MGKPKKQFPPLLDRANNKNFRIDANVDKMKRNNLTVQKELKR